MILRSRFIIKEFDKIDIKIDMWIKGDEKGRSIYEIILLGEWCLEYEYQGTRDIVVDYIVDNYLKDKKCYLDIRKLEDDLELMFETLEQETNKREKEKILKQVKAKHGLSFTEQDILDGALSLS